MHISGPSRWMVTSNPILGQAREASLDLFKPGILHIPGPERDGSNFANPLLLAVLNTNDVQLQAKNGTDNFGTMKASRDRGCDGITLGSEIQLSNVGVSVALTVWISGRKYALLAYRGGEANRHMLISGYTDVVRSAFLPTDPDSGATFFRENALLNLRGELVIVDCNSQLVSLGIKGQHFFAEYPLPEYYADNDKVTQLPPPYKSLGDVVPFKEILLTPTPLPKFLGDMLGSQEDQSITFNGTKFKNVGFQYCKSFNSGQLIFPFEISLPNGGKGLSLFHAEDRLIKNGILETSLDVDGIVLVELDLSGELTPETFWLRDGRLVPRTRHKYDNIKLSEAFDRRNPSSELPGWCVKGNDVMFNARAG
jgi:hypothetical protein